LNFDLHGAHNIYLNSDALFYIYIVVQILSAVILTEPGMTVSLQHRLRTIENDFLLAANAGDANAGDSAWQAVLATWLELKEDIHKATEQNSLGEETMAIIYTTSSRLSILSESFLDLDRDSKALTSALTSDLDDIFAQAIRTQPPITALSGEIYCDDFGLLVIDIFSRWSPQFQKHVTPNSSSLSSLHRIRLQMASTQYPQTLSHCRGDHVYLRKLRHEREENQELVYLCSPTHGMVKDCKGTFSLGQGRYGGRRISCSRRARR
jgi:hypothetical protein